MFSYVDRLFSDPRGTLIVLLLALPGRLLAICGHEAAHAYAAYRCGDPTAKFCGRMTLDPRKHLDLVGTLMMLLLGFGWAKPVPVNPLNYRHPRRDDIIVSLAGITANLLMAVAWAVLMYALLGWAIYRVNSDYSLLALYYRNGLDPVAAAFGTIPGYIYRMMQYAVAVNIALAVFNLLPVPPLDGYHVLNDLILKKNLFASPKATQIASFIMIGLIVTGVIGEGIGYVVDIAFDGFSAAASAVYRVLGIY